MYGIDYWAHYYALKFGLKTIAVLPCGVDVIHPREHKDLYNRVVFGGGLVVSEYALGYYPRKWTYVKRNRIVAGLSKAVVIVEASDNSGSIITANYADKYGRKVFSVPNSIFELRSRGSNSIINKYATLIESGNQINELLGTSDVRCFQDQSSYSFEDKEIKGKLLKLLGNSGMSLDEIVNTLNLKTNIISRLITSMTVDGLIENKRGLFYAC
jgi:DNA processing protein